MRFRVAAAVSLAALVLILAAPPASGQSEDVVWTTAVGVTVSGNNLTKTAAFGLGYRVLGRLELMASGDTFLGVSFVDNQNLVVGV